MSLHPLAGKPAPRELLVNVPRLISAYYTEHPDPANPAQRVSFGTSGHRGSSLKGTFNEDHIAAVCQAIVEYRAGAGITGLYASADVGKEDREKAEAILRAVGEVVWVPEERLIDPVTAVSASGPAYVFWFIEQLAAAAEKLGIAKEDAMKLAKQTVLGAAQLASQSPESPETLRKNVTSKGGTTEAALNVFSEEKLAERFIRAVEAASKRGEEMGRELGKD